MVAFWQHRYSQGLRILIIAALIGCSAEGGADDLAARLASACEKSSNLGTAMCRCVGDQAKADLSPDGLQLLVAMLEKDDAAIESVRRTASLQDAAAAATFMTRAPAACARSGIQPTPKTPEE